MSFERSIPESLKKALELVAQIPTYGERGASRFIYNFLKLDREKRVKISEALLELSQKIRECKECGLFTEDEVCPICRERNKKFIMVVEESKDAFWVEKLGKFKGVYHVLGGRLSPMEGVGVEELRIDSLLERVRKYNPREVIIATSPNLEGEATANYLIKLLKRFYKGKLSRIALGLSFGTTLEFSDEGSLLSSLKNRKEL